jgi:ceramide glucosyltransferase
VHACWLLFLPACAYQLLAIIAELRYLRARKISVRNALPPDSDMPGVSVLKPLRGLDPNTRDAFVSQLKQAYPKFEVLFGVHDSADPAAQEVIRLQAEFTQAEVRLITSVEQQPNAKVAILSDLARAARYPIYVVNDSDIKVDPQYLKTVAAPLCRPPVGLVTCLYRVKAHNPPAAWEALGIMTDFMPSTLVAQLIGVRDFGLGSTLAFRAADLERAGGFASLGAYLADDYQLARRITSLGLQAVLSPYIVETSLGDATWQGVWHHQLRWARTIRLSKGAGYAGLPFTHAGIWAALALALEANSPGAGALPALLLTGLRVLSAFLSGAFVLRSPLAAGFCWLTPAWDLYSFAVWCASYAGRKVRWRDRILTIGRDGRIETSASPAV